jgi:hypothetical protein
MWITTSNKSQKETRITSAALRYKKEERTSEPTTVARPE